MDDLKQLQLKANDGKAYQFTAAKIKSSKVAPSQFKTQQRATLHIQKFIYIRPKRVADLLAVLGMLDFPAEIRARSGGPALLSAACNTLAKALFDDRLWVYEVPAIDPVVVHQPTVIEQIRSAKKHIDSKGGKEEKSPAGKGSVKTDLRLAMPDDMVFCGDPVSMATGE